LRAATAGNPAVLSVHPAGRDARKTSFSATARKPQRVQSAISKAMASLEGQLGVALDRSTRKPAAARRVLLEMDLRPHRSARAPRPSRWHRGGVGSDTDAPITASGHDRGDHALPAPAQIAGFAWRDITSKQRSLRPVPNKQ
jgi:hypothetical protein